MIKINGPVGEALAKALDEQPKPEAVVAPAATPEPTPEVPISKPETPTAATPTPVNPEVPVELETEDWDVSQPAPVNPTPDVPSQIDFSELGKSAGLGEAKTKEEFLAKIKTLETKALEGVPDNLKKALELAKQGGDYLSYLKVSQFDYNNVDPEELFRTDLYSRIKQANPQGTKADLETKYQEALAAYAPIQQLIEGQKLQKSYSDWQKSEALRIEQEARQKKQTADSKIKESIDKLDEINGFKIKPSHKASMYEYITSGELQKDLFSETGYNYDALVEIAFNRKYGKKANEFLWNKAKSSTKKEFVKELTNPQIDKPSEPLQVKVEEKSAMQLWLESLKAKNQK